jgi:uncharacterized surface protein with fasciclin (FAS1) repeats
MLNGEVLSVTLNSLSVSVTTTSDKLPRLLLAYVEVTVVHIIDGVLLPSAIRATVIDLATYSTLLSPITTAGWRQISVVGPFTLFAPTNTALGSAT